jgi:hypothetical protein
MVGHPYGGSPLWRVSLFHSLSSTPLPPPCNAGSVLSAFRSSLSHFIKPSQALPSSLRTNESLPPGPPPPEFAAGPSDKALMAGPRGFSERTVAAPSAVSLLDPGSSVRAEFPRPRDTGDSQATTIHVSLSPMEHVSDAVFQGHLPKQVLKGGFMFGF